MHICMSQMQKPALVSLFETHIKVYFIYYLKILQYGALSKS